MHNSIHGITIRDASGARVWDTDNKEYIDFTSGIFAGNLGMHNFEVAEAIKFQASFCMHSYQFDTEAKREYLKKLCEFTGFEAAYLFSSGTEATEAAWKIARKHTGRPGIWSLGLHAFHGKTFGAQVMTGAEQDWRNQTPGEKTGALIFEPYRALTAELHPKETVERIKRLQNEFGLILIADEIQAGFGRTGKLFGFQNYESLNPDLVCIGKGMANGFPCSAVIGPDLLVNDPMMELSSTNGGNPLACAAGSAVIREFERRDVVSLSNDYGLYFQGLLDSEVPVKTTGVGMVAAVHFADAPMADLIVRKCAENGLLVVHTGKYTVKLGPPLVIRPDQIERGVSILAKTIKEVIK